MFNFRALRQIGTVIRFWITVPIWFKRKKLCLVARLRCMFNEYDSYVPNFSFEFQIFYLFKLSISLIKASTSSILPT